MYQLMGDCYAGQAIPVSFWIWLLFSWCRWTSTWHWSLAVWAMGTGSCVITSSGKSFAVHRVIWETTGQSRECFCTVSILCHISLHLRDFKCVGGERSTTHVATHNICKEGWACSQFCSKRVSEVPFRKLAKVFLSPVCQRYHTRQPDQRQISVLNAFFLWIRNIQPYHLYFDYDILS